MARALDFSRYVIHNDGRQGGVVGVATGSRAGRSLKTLPRCSVATGPRVILEKTRQACVMYVHCGCRTIGIVAPEMRYVTWRHKVNLDMSDGSRMLFLEGWQKFLEPVDGRAWYWCEGHKI